MTMDEVRALVDKGYRIKSKYDKLEVELEAIKNTLKAEAKKRKKNALFGNEHFALVGPTSTTECDPYELYHLLDGDEDQFFPLVKPLVGEVKKAVGETAFETISTTKTFPYNKIGFKEKVPKKYLEKK